PSGSHSDFARPVLCGLYTRPTVLRRTVVTREHAMPCHAMPCHAMPCHAMPWRISLEPHLTIEEREGRYPSTKGLVERTHWHFLWLLVSGLIAKLVASIASYLRVLDRVYCPALQPAWPRRRQRSSAPVATEHPAPN